MKLIPFFEKQINKWNVENKCGQCFRFYAPLTEESLNKQQIEDCCVNVMLTRDRNNAFGVDRTYNALLGNLSDTFEYKNFTLFFIVPQGVNLNNYKEILNNDTTNSKSVLLEDLEQCIIDTELNFCEFIGQDWQLTQWNAQQLLNFRDNNYTGYRVNVSIRKRKLK